MCKMRQQVPLLTSQLALVRMDSSRHCVPTLRPIPRRTCEGWQVCNAASIVKFNARNVGQKVESKAQGKLRIVLEPLVDFALDIEGASSDARAVASPIADAELHRVPSVCEVWQTT